MADTTTAPPFKYRYARIGISSQDEWVKFLEADRLARDRIAEMMSQAQAEAMHSIAEQMENGNIGPLHRPGRVELGEVRRRERNIAALRAMGHPAGSYRQ